MASNKCVAMDKRPESQVTAMKAAIAMAAAAAAAAAEVAAPATATKKYGRRAGRIDGLKFESRRKILRIFDWSRCASSCARPLKHAD